MNYPYFVIQKSAKGKEWHNEDSWRVSETKPIFAVADGVTVLPFIDDPKLYGAGSRPLADAFCIATVEYLEQNWDELSFETFKQAYLAADQKIAELNKNRPKPLATVASLAAVKDGIIWGSRLTDCGWALVRQGQIIYKTPEFWTWKKEQSLAGYGILTGQLQINYLDLKQLPGEPGDFLLVFSDGFEKHFSEPEFLRAFRGEDLEAVKKRIEVVDENFNEERTLVVARILL